MPYVILGTPQNLRRQHGRYPPTAADAVVALLGNLRVLEGDVLPAILYVGTSAGLVAWRYLPVSAFSSSRTREISSSV